MRTATIAALPLLLLACRTGPGVDPPVQPEGEVPHGAAQLLVERFDRAGTRDWYTMEPDGSRVEPFRAVPPEVVRLVPSPDGRSFVEIVALPGGELHLWRSSRDGSERRPLIEGDRVVKSVAWSPDGARLALGMSTPDHEDDLWVVGADGTGLLDLTPDLPGTAVFDRDPCWSPDGARIVFASNRGGTVSSLWTVAPDGTGLAPVRPAGSVGSERLPAWSPDGASIAFLGAIPGSGGAGLVRPDGSGYRLLPGTEAARWPTWSPDGRLVYSTDTEGNFELHAVDPAAGAQVNLTRHLAHDYRAVELRRVEPGPWKGLAPLQRLEAGAGAGGLAAGDLEGDGAVDLTLADGAGARLRLLAGKGGGLVGPLGALDAPGDQRVLLAAHLDTSPGADLALLGAGALQVWSGGPGGPGAPLQLALSGVGRGLAAADFTWSGASQLAAAVEAPDGAMRLVLADVDPGGALRALRDQATDYRRPGQACAADVTGDGSVDLLVTTREAAAPLLLVATEGISLGAPEVAATGVAVDAAEAPLCADLDGDRRADVVLVRPGQPQGLAVLRSLGRGLSAPVELGVRADAAVAVDLDGDGDVDLVAVRRSPGALLLLRNLGDGHFAAPVTLAAGGAPSRVTAADLDGDGWPDLAVADADGSLATWRNRAR